MSYLIRVEGFAVVDKYKKEVVMGDEIKCEDEGARMNCKRMMGHPFVGRKKLLLIPYDKQDRWTVRLSEGGVAAPIATKRDRATS